MMKVVLERRIPTGSSITGTRAVLRTMTVLLLFCVCSLWSILPCSQAWTLPRHTTHRLSSTRTTTQYATSSIQNPTSPTSTASNTRTSNDKDEQIDELKAEIARMRQEALARLELLNQEMHSAEMAWNEQATLNEPWAAATAVTAQPLSSSTTAATTTTTALSSSTTSSSTSTTLMELAPSAEAKSEMVQEPTVGDDDESHEIDQLYQARKERESLHFLETLTPDETRTTHNTLLMPSLSSSTLSTPHSKSLKLLEDTRWRLVMNIGREPGTWMSKSWGASGDRLRLHLELEFTKEQLYEREDFLNGISGAQVLRVVNSQADLAPCLSHGGRKIRISSQAGGWRVAPKEGPMGTSVLRFYFDLEEEARHPGSDVYCPAGRIYCTCGYFSMDERHKQGVVSEKESLKQEMRLIEATYEGLAADNEVDTDLFSWKKLQRSKQLMDLRAHATKLNQKMHEAHVREPDRALLRLSRDQSVGLTKEGGVCCKVHKGLAIEYHILGKFEIASMENRAHSDYRDLLP